MKIFNLKNLGVALILLVGLSACTPAENIEDSAKPDPITVNTETETETETEIETEKETDKNKESEGQEKDKVEPAETKEIELELEGMKETVTGQLFKSEQGYFMYTLPRLSAREAYEVGARGYIIKPFDRMKLLELFRNLRINI
jgi:hypothetical protein